MEQVQITEEEELYIGSVAVYFKEIEGHSYSWTHDTLSEITDKASKELANTRTQTLLIDGQHLVLPAIPAADHQLSISEKNSAESLPVKLRVPLIKVDHSSIVGIQSGARSALMKINGEWYRLKGCGDMTKGFPLEFVNNNNIPKAREIRGCAFEHTTYRELYISSYVNDILKPLGLECANKPIGWWKYNVTDAPFPQVNRCCILMKTLGNKRLGDNVLLGLEKLLPFIVSLSNFDSILNYFPKDRLDNEITDGCPIFPTCMVSLAGEFGGEIDFHNFGFIEMAPDFNQFKDTVNPKWASFWSKCSEILRKYNSSNPKQSLFSHIYWRLGRETGVICRCFSLHNFSWGTYVDLLGFHCNSHINNLVLIPQNKSVPGSPLLAPLDFDMAFTENSFSREKNHWDEWMYLEKSGMKLILAGDTETNTGVKVPVKLSPQYTVIKYALRDTMMVAFNEALDGKEDRHPPIPGLDDQIYSLLKLALILTENETA